MSQLALESGQGYGYGYKYYDYYDRPSRRPIVYVFSSKSNLGIDVCNSKHRYIYIYILIGAPRGPGGGRMFSITMIARLEDLGLLLLSLLLSLLLTLSLTLLLL